MANNSIQQILQAEKSADTIIKRAEQAKAQKIAKAREKALEMLITKKKEIEQAVDAQARQQMKKIEEEKQKIEREYADEAEKLGKRAKPRIDKAASFLFEKFANGVTE